MQILKELAEIEEKGVIQVKEVILEVDMVEVEEMEMDMREEVVEVENSNFHHNNTDY